MEDSITKAEAGEDGGRILCDKCNYCVRIGGSLQDLRRHMITVHKEVFTKNIINTGCILLH